MSRMKTRRSAASFLRLLAADRTVRRVEVEPMVIWVPLVPIEASSAISTGTSGMELIASDRDIVTFLGCVGALLKRWNCSS